MSPEQRKRITYDLAMEYVKQHQEFNHTQSEIPSMVENFSNICEQFDAALSSNQKIQSLF